MTPAEREVQIARYERGVTLLKDALARVPKEALQWRPARDKWSVHEVIVHCADSETNSASRIRYLMGESSPAIAGYDQDRWATAFDYHRLPLDLSLKQVEAVRAWTAAFIRSLPASSWTRSGRHSEMKEPYSAETWLSIYAEHLEIHARQILRNLEAWTSRKP